eukprot:4595948-Pyramimonas_sp.AAC.1
MRASIVKHHAHLGSVIDCQGYMGPEVRYRASSATATLRVLRNRSGAIGASSQLGRLDYTDNGGGQNC